MTDRYEREFMGGDEAIHQDKIVWGQRWILSVPGVVAAVAAITTLAAGGVPWWVPLQLTLVSLLFAALWLLFSVLRTVVTHKEVNVQYGLWGPRVALDRIESVEVVDYDWTAFGGWGLKYSVTERAWAYTVTGHGSEVVQLSWRDDAGKKHKAVFSASNPHALVQAIGRARTAAAGGKRIGAEDDATDAAYREALAEAEAMAEDLAAKEERADEHDEPPPPEG